MPKLRLFAAPGLMFALLFLAAPTVRAGDGAPTQKAVDRATAFLKSADRGSFIVSYLHAGADFNGHKYLERRTVVDGDKKTIPGHFALIYSFTWDGDGKTKVAFLFDEDGDFYKLHVMDTTAVLSQPFAVAELSIKILGAAVIDLLKDNLTAAEKKQLQKIVDDADPKALLELGLTFQQKFGK